MINWADFIAGWAGGICGLVIGHPMDTIKTRQQAKGLSFTKIFVDTYKHEGFLGFYKGFSVPFLTVGPSNAVFFFTYAEALKKLQIGGKEDIVRLDINNPDWKWNAGLAGIIGGFAQVLVTCPVELIKTVMQTSVMTGSKTPYVFHSTRDAIKGIYQYRGIFWFYRGCVSMMLRDIPSSCIYTLAYEWLLPRNRDLQIMDLIIAGGLAGSTSWAVIVPFDVIKTRMQSDNMAQPEFKRTIDCAKSLYRTSGLKIFGRGFTVTIMRAFPVNAAIFAAYEGCLMLFKKFNIT
ncbi:hypothetical protein RN001_000692 [Aquatica leii]|uniref:Solute carrier family 25 member 45 n=1 Tax=Aquatica leii TaxID=1421715 RepID=A0AAN7PMM2_9COLE|nr:hypothetical protein RN001_000692 [Aquatica leii]